MNPEQYTPGYSHNATQFMAQRHADAHAGFFMPYLKPGMSVLDCGCGPGSITLDLATQLTEGYIIGIDINESQIETAQNQGSHLKNIHFQIANVYDLPFDHGQFDAVFSHALMEHLSDPIAALQEIKRVLKPQGILGVCSPDWRGFIISPLTPALEAAIHFYQKIQIENGGNPYIGAHLATLMLKAGFHQVSADARYECYPDRELIGEYLAQRLECAPQLDKAIEKNLIGAQTLQEMIQALRTWQHKPEGLFAQTWISAVGYVPR